MLDMVVVKDRLLAACPALAGRVEVGMDVEQAKKRAINAPTALVMDLAEQAGEPVASTGLHLQRIRARFGVLLALPGQRRLGDVGGLREVRAEVRNALLGWSPFDGATEAAFVSGQMSDAQAGVIWWLDVFETIYSERA